MSKEKDSVEKVEKKSFIVLVTVLIVVLLGVFGLGGWLIGAMKVINSYSAQCVSREDDSQGTNSVGADEVETAKCEATSAKCYGTYYVNGNKDDGEYILKEDGTYKVVGQEEAGVFVIHSNTITFIQMKHTAGPIDQDAIYTNPKSYFISEDCSSIRFTPYGSDTSAGLIKVD